MWKKLKGEMTSCPVRLHLWRGVAGLSLLIAAALVFSEHLLGSVALVAFAAFFLRGCPICWTFWLYEAAEKKKQQEKR